MSKYEAQAEKIRKEIGFDIKIAFKGDKCPEWCDGTCRHGDRYRVTLKREGQKSYSFDFWNSLNDMQAGKRPTSYDVIACLEYYVTDSLDDFVSEFGYEIDSVKSFKRAERIHKACLKMSDRLSDMFSDDELQRLGEIR